MIRTRIRERLLFPHKRYVFMVFTFTIAHRHRCLALYVLSVSFDLGLPVDKNSRRLNWNNLLEHFVTVGNIKAVKLLIRHNANLNWNNGSPVMLSIEYVHENVLRLLLESGASPIAKNRLDATAIETALLHSSASIVRLLLQHGAAVRPVVFSRLAQSSRIDRKLKIAISKSLIKPK